MDKRTLLMLGIAAILTISFLTIQDDSSADTSYELEGIEGLGTESNPYLIDSAEDLNVLDELSDTMHAGTSISVRMISDIDITGVNVNSTHEFISGFRGTFDGDGHKITGSNDNAVFLFYRTYGENVIKNLVVETGTNFSLALVNNDGNLLMSDITIEDNGVGTMTNGNYAPFIIHTFGNLTMERCVNNADLIVGKYGSAFIGGYARYGCDITIKDCENHGNIFGVNASLFLGNPSDTDIDTITIENFTNTGSVTGTEGASYFCSLSSSSYAGVFDILNKKCVGEPGTVNTGGPLSNSSGSATVKGYSIEVFANAEEGPEVTGPGAELTNSNGTYSVTSDSSDKAYAKFSFNALAQGNGTFRTYIHGNEVIFEGNSATLDIPLGMLVTKDLAEIQYGISKLNPVSSGTTGNGFPWDCYKIGESYIYAVDFGNSEWNFTNATSIDLNVTVYSESGAIVGFASDSVTVTKPTPTETEVSTFYRVYVGSEGYVDVQLDSRFVAAGATLKFSLKPAEGYDLNDDVVVKAYTDYNKTTELNCVANADGTYSISDVQSNVYIYVEMPEGDESPIIPLRYSVSYDLSNVTSSSTVVSVVHNAPFVTTLTPIDGYRISDVTITMGGVEIAGAYDLSTGRVDIENVTGDVVISASASSTSWGDDEDLPPFIPTQPEEDDNTVTIVACAAAAAVAAIMAVFLIIDRKG